MMNWYVFTCTSLKNDFFEYGSMNYKENYESHITHLTAFTQVLRNVSLAGNLKNIQSSLLDT